MNALTITECGDIDANNAAGPSFINEAPSDTNPTLCPNKTEDDTGIGWQSNVLHLVLSGADEYNFSTTSFSMDSNTIDEAGAITVANAAGPTIINEAATSTNPTIIPNRAEDDTGIGWASDTIYVVLHDSGEYSFSDATLDMNSNTLTEVGLITSEAGITIEDSYGINFGTDSDVVVKFDSGETALVAVPIGNFVSLEGMSHRYRLEWVAGQEGKPGINVNVVSADSSVVAITDPYFEILGTNASSDDVTYYAEGGITFQTDGSDGDAVILLPHLDTNLSAWEQVNWGTDNEVRWEASIRTDSPITTSIIWAGLKLTNTSDSSTDANQVYFRYEDDMNSGEWEAINSIANVDDAEDTDVVVAGNTVYHLVIEIDSSRIAKFYINGALVETSAALTDAIDLIPYIGIEEDGAGSARKLYIRGQVISRLAE
jgi:hypothetical protein